MRIRIENMKREDDNIPDPECSKGCKQWGNCLVWEDLKIIEQCPCNNCLIKSMCESRCEGRIKVYYKKMNYKSTSRGDFNPKWKIML